MKIRNKNYLAVPVCVIASVPVPKDNHCKAPVATTPCAVFSCLRPVANPLYKPEKTLSITINKDHATTIVTNTDKVNEM